MRSRLAATGIEVNRNSVKGACRLLELVRRLTKWSPLWGGVIVALVAVLLLSFLLGLVLHLTPLSEAYLESYALAVVTLGVFLGAFAAAQAAQSRGLLHGAMVAAVFLFLVLAISLLGPFETSLGVFVKSGLAALVAGVLGGIVGVSWR